MNATEVLRKASAVGIRISLEGSDLLLEAAERPPMVMMELLSRHKFDIVGLLQSGDESFADAFAALKSKCPDYVDIERWEQCMRDARRFLQVWGRQAEALRWSAMDLFRLHEPPLMPHPTYQRLSRFDETGLLWLLCGRHVLALTETTAVIQCSGKSPVT
jgi:hypothetical protein